MERKLSSLLIIALTVVGFIPSGTNSHVNHRLAQGGPGQEGTILNEREPNNSGNAATPVPPLTRYVRAAINPVGDVDLFSFTATQGDYVFISVDTTPSTTSRDSSLRLLMGNRVIAADEDNGPNPLASGLAGVRITRTGTHQVEVRENGNNETISEYRLFLCVLPGPVRMEVEPNDAIENAALASNVNGGLINMPGDVDGWRFQAPEMSTLAISLDQTVGAGGFDGVLELIDPMGMTVAVQNNNGERAGNAEFLNVLSLPLTGVYTIRVREARISQGDERFDYLLGICLNGRPLRRAPIADAGDDVGVLETETVTLDGSRSRGLDGEPLSYEWTQVSGDSIPFASGGPLLTFIAPQLPVAALRLYVFELKVTTPFGLSATDRVTVRVSDRFMLRDDMTPHRVLLNLAAPSFTWTTPTGASITRPMTIVTLSAELLDIDTQGDDYSFAAGVTFREKSGKAVLLISNTRFTINDSNYEDSQGGF
ncbi:MAG: hypothetical protein RMM98_12180 [Acidobacteriota bacterium]|nr:hypothetical protein [Blastocatellia bacterium]MDW8240367.1 hypothetical protein [Acidobacteriota bacterium]